MALIDFLTGGNKLDGDSNGSMFARLKDAAGNGIGKLHRALIPSTQEALLMAVKNDQIAVMQRGDRKGNAIIGNYIPEIVENFESTQFNVQRWLQTLTTFVAAQTTIGGYNHNSTTLTTASAVSILQSQRQIMKFPRVPLHLKLRKRHSMVSGSIADFGFGIPSSTTLIVPNGVMFRLTNSGVIQGVITYNNSEVAIASIVSQVASNGNSIGGNLNMSAAYYTSNYFVYDIIIDDDNAVFTIQDTATGEMIGMLSLPVPIAVQKMWGATSLPVYDRVYNASAPASAPVDFTTELQVLSTDWNLSPDMSQLAASIGLSGGRAPYTGFQNENHANSAAPASATLSNTAAGYTTLGGKFQFAAVAGAETDYALFGFQVPTGSRFLCEGVHIELYNTVVAVATTPTIFEWAMGFNSSAVSLATGNIIRRQIGCQNFQVGAGVGACATPLDVLFVTPEAVESGRFVHVILKMPVGTATATEIFRGQVLVRGRFL